MRSGARTFTDVLVFPARLGYTRLIPVPWLPPGGRTHRKEPDGSASQRYFWGKAQVGRIVAGRVDY